MTYYSCTSPDLRFPVQHQSHKRYCFPDPLLPLLPVFPHRPLPRSLPQNRQTGERETDFINVVAWRQTAEFVSRYFTKGRMAVVEGRLQIRSYTDRDGNKRTAAEVVAENFYFGDSRREGESGSYGGQSYSAPSAPSQPSGGYAAPSGEDQFTELVGDEDNLPF